MNLLLDTHIALWSLGDSPKLPAKARELIIDPDNTVYYSVVSTWEVLMKHDAPNTNLSLTASDHEIPFLTVSDIKVVRYIRF
jgi:PIN domain nuclease of toxin-antitoxin system